ncbi:MAG: hypothetical protein AAFV43_07050 [Planctomycetota bacterium]
MAVLLLLLATLLVAAALIGGVAYSLFGPDVPPVISEETTLITEPLAADGWPDYEEWVRREWSKGVTPEENGAIPFWSVMGRHWSDGDVRLAELQKELGGPAEFYRSLSSPRKLSTTLESWLNTNSEVPVAKEAIDAWDDGEQLDALLELAQRQPWTDDELPPLADWLNRNETQLAVLREAAARPKFYPSSPSLLDGRPGETAAVLLPAAQGARDAARALVTSAMNQLAEQRIDLAWDDVRAATRLAQHVENGPFFIDLLIARAMRNIINDATLALVAHPGATASLIDTVVAFRRRHSAPASVLDRLLETERLMTIANAYCVATNHRMRTMREPPLPTRLYGLRVDFTVTLREIDRTFAASEPVDGEAFDASLKRIADVHQELAARIAQPVLWIDTVSLSERSRWLARQIAHDSAWWQAADTCARHERWVANDRLLNAAFEIVAEQQRSGGWPARPARERPSSYSDQPLRYQRLSDGFLLYDAGPNGGDDGGDFHRKRGLSNQPSRSGGEVLEDDDPRHADLSPEADDVAIRFPPPMEPWPWERDDVDTTSEP